MTYNPVNYIRLHQTAHRDCLLSRVLEILLLTYCTSIRSAIKVHVGWRHCTPRHEHCRILSAVVGPVYSNLHHECELPCPNDFRHKQGVLKLMVGALPLTLYTAQKGIVIVRTGAKYLD